MKYTTAAGSFFTLFFAGLFFSIRPYPPLLSVLAGGLFGLGLTLLYCFGSKRVLHRLIALFTGLFVGLCAAFFLREITTFEGPILFFLQMSALGLSLVAALKFSDEIVSSPATATPDLFIDSEALKDPRILDLAASGLIDHTLVLPSFVLAKLKSEASQTGLAHLKKIEELPEVDLRYTDSDFPNESSLEEKMKSLCHQKKGRWLTSCSSSIKEAGSLKKGLRIIDLESLSKRFKPLQTAGEVLQIKIQRPGKEEGQGVGYLEDGTMVVVNGGGEYIGCTINVDVLSTKQTMAGRIIFCNAQENSHLEMPV